MTTLLAIITSVVLSLASFAPAHPRDAVVVRDGAQSCCAVLESGGVADEAQGCEKCCCKECKTCCKAGCCKKKPKKGCCETARKCGGGVFAAP